MKLQQLCDAAGISRQGFLQWAAMRERPAEGAATPEGKVLELARYVRRNHLPGAGARELYRFIRRSPDLDGKLLGWGKHRFEGLCLHNGMEVKRVRFVPKTTQRGEFVFENLIAGMEVADINKVLVSDICYVFGSRGQLLGYATTLMDLYSRLLPGLSFSKDMRAVNTSLPVLEQALAHRGPLSLNGAIFHSDGGKQYIQKDFIASLRRAGMVSSMADNCYENAHAEALNDTLKNHMLVDLDLNSFSQLKKHEAFIKNAYNQNKTHSGIGNMTPMAYEQQIASLQICQRTVLKVKPIQSGNGMTQEFCLRGSLGLSEQAGF
jgi:transposase InsO family protein